MAVNTSLFNTPMNTAVVQYGYDLINLSVFNGNVSSHITIIVNTRKASQTLTLPGHWIILCKMASILAAEFHRSAQTIGDGRFLFTCLVSTMILLLVFKQSAEATETTSPAATLSDAQCPAPNINIQVVV